MRPGPRQVGNRLKSSNWTGRSSRQTTGSIGSSGLSYRSSSSSMRSTYCRSSARTHHIFFPPGLQVVLLEQEPDGLAADRRNHLSLRGLLGDQAHAPAGVSFWRPGADHGDDLCTLALVEAALLSRPWSFVQ